MSASEQTFKSGQQVTYITGQTNDIQQIGIIKSMCDDGVHAFVVYNCGDDWDNFANYTGARTRISDLVNFWTNNGKQQHERI